MASKIANAGKHTILEEMIKRAMQEDEQALQYLDVEDKKWFAARVGGNEVWLQGDSGFVCGNKEAGDAEVSINVSKLSEMYEATSQNKV